MHSAVNLEIISQICFLKDLIKRKKMVFINISCVRIRSRPIGSDGSRDYMWLICNVIDHVSIYVVNVT